MCLGNTGETLLSEKELGHLTAKILLENDLFKTAGRMIAHSFVYDGARLAGLSPAILHVLIGNPAESATVPLNDCADRVIIEMVMVPPLWLYMIADLVNKKADPQNFSFK